MTFSRNIKRGNVKKHYCYFCGLGLFALLFITCYSMEDVELGLPSSSTCIAIKASDNKIVHIDPDMFPQLGQYKASGEPIPLSKISKLQCSGQDLKSLLGLFSTSDKIKDLAYYTEVASIVQFVKELDIRKDILDLLESLASSIPLSTKSPAEYEGELNLSKKGIFSMLGLYSFLPLENISKVDLSHNSIERFDLKFLRRLMPHLRHLNVSYNQITKLRRSMLEGMPAGFYVDISDNPINKLGSGVMKAIVSLRDKSISISLYRTLLPQDTLASLASSIKRASYKHLGTRIGLTAYFVVALVGSIALKAYAESEGTAVASDSSSMLSEVSQTYPYYLFDWSADAAFISASISAIASQVAWIFQHDAHESRLYCDNMS